MAVASVAMTELTGIATGSFQDVDLDSFVTVPSGATGAIIDIHNPSASDYTAGARANGSTDNRTATHGNNSWIRLAVALDANHIVEVYISNTAQKVYVRDFFGDESTFFTNGVAKSPASSGLWLDVDISANTGADTAIVGIFHMHSVGGSRTFGMRKNGSTDARLQTMDNSMIIIGVDASEICEQQTNDTDADNYLMGYVTDQATFDTNATDKSTGTTGSYQDVDTFDSGKSHGVYEVYATATANAWMRTKGETDDLYDAPAFNHAWTLVKGDASRIVEGKISATTTDFFRIGQFDAAAGGTSSGSISEAASAAATWTATASATGAIAEAASAASTMSAVATAIAALTAAATASDSANGPATALASLAASASGAELMAAVAQAAAAIAQAAAAGETWVGTAQALATLAANGAATETISGSSSDVEQAALSASTSAAASFLAAVSAIAVLTEVASAQAAITATVSAIASVVEAANAQATFSGDASDADYLIVGAITITRALSASVSISRALSGTVSLERALEVTSVEIKPN